MDQRKLIELLSATINPTQREHAEEQLTQVRELIGFPTTLIQVVMRNDLDPSVRQAGAIYLKNLISQKWVERQELPTQFSIHEEDKLVIRDFIVDATVQAPELIRLQLAVCISHIIRHDFPAKWPQFVNKVSMQLQNQDPDSWNGALVALYQLVKNYEYKKPDERIIFLEAMKSLLPMMYSLCINLLPDPRDSSLFLQKLILKIFYGLCQYTLPLELFSRDVFSRWMEIMQTIIYRPTPEQQHMEINDIAELPCWKCKKWAAHFVARIFERFGSPGFVPPEYNDFSTWYLQSFSHSIIEAILKILNEYRNNMYVAPRVMQQCLNYISQAVNHAYSWKILKPHLMDIINYVIFPLLKYSPDDEELWDEDPHEYIRIKFDVFEDFVSPVSAAQAVLYCCCKKRKGMLQKTMQLTVQILDNSNALASEKDGALHMIGSLADILRKKQNYKTQMEHILIRYVFPAFESNKGHMRARACWVLLYFSDIHFKQESFLVQAVKLIVNALLHDRDLPVKVQAGIALQNILNVQDKSHSIVEPDVTKITSELLSLIRETENEDLASALQKIVCIFSEQLIPIAVEMCLHLVGTLKQILSSDEGTDDTMIAAIGLQNTIETILDVMKDRQDILIRLEPIVIEVIQICLQYPNNEFCDDGFSLTYHLTSRHISPEMWKVFENIYEVLKRYNGCEFFIDMMPTLHNYVTVDTNAFLSNENYFYAMYDMTKTVLTSVCSEDVECHAAKLLEIIILQCKGRIDNCIPTIVELILNRLMREIKTADLRIMCLQVIIAALFYNPQLLFQSMEKLSNPALNESIALHFIKQWRQDVDHFFGLHDRKLSVLGLCTLISMNPGRPPLVNEVVHDIIPMFISLFNGLKTAYISKAHEQEAEDESDEDDDEIEEPTLSSDEDDISDSATYRLIAGVNSDDSDSDYEKNSLENFLTSLDSPDSEIDEFIIFKEVMMKLEATEPNWYANLITGLSAEQHKSLQEIIVLANQREAAMESKKIAKSGGYSFTQHTVPTTFKFGTTSLNP